MIWGSSQLIQFPKEAGIKRFIAKKACCKEKAKNIAGQSFVNASERPKHQSVQSQAHTLEMLFEEIKYVTHRSPQSPKVEGWDYLGKIYSQASFLQE